MTPQHAAAAAVGPVVIGFFGLDVPIMPAVFGVAGVVLGRYLAHAVKREGEDKMAGRANLALTALFGLAMIAFASEMGLTPFRALGYGAAAGFLGLGLLELVATQFAERLRGAIEGFFNPRK